MIWTTTELGGYIIRILTCDGMGLKIFERHIPADVDTFTEIFLPTLPSSAFEGPFLYVEQMCCHGSAVVVLVNGQVFLLIEPYNKWIQLKVPTGETVSQVVASPFAIVALTMSSNGYYYRRSDKDPDSDVEFKHYLSNILSICRGTKFDSTIYSITTKSEFTDIELYNCRLATSKIIYSPEIIDKVQPHVPSFQVSASERYFDPNNVGYRTENLYKKIIGDLRDALITTKGTVFTVDRMYGGEQVLTITRQRYFDQNQLKVTSVCNPIKSSRKVMSK